MAELLKFKDYTWPENPESCSIVCKRPVSLSEGAQAQSARAPREVRGEGILVSKQVREQYSALWALFCTDGAGTLEPVGLPSMNAFLTELEFEQTPYENTLRYRFVFTEAV